METTVVWASKHSPLHEQIEALTSKFGQIKIVRYPHRIYDGRGLLEVFRKVKGPKELAVVAPGKVFVYLSLQGVQPLRSVGVDSPGQFYRFSHFERVTCARFKTDSMRKYGRANKLLWLSDRDCTPELASSLRKYFKAGEDLPIWTDNDPMQPSSQTVALILEQHFDFVYAQVPLWKLSEIKYSVPKSWTVFLVKDEHPARKGCFRRVKTALWETEIL